MGGYGGLVELALVFALVLGWGIYELRSVRRDSKKAKDTGEAKSIANDDH